MRCLYANENGEDNIAISFTGDYLDADNNISNWPLANILDLKYWKGHSVTQWKGVVKNVFSDLIYGKCSL